jgi:excisionase family DNA binding protein
MKASSHSSKSKPISTSWTIRNLAEKWNCSIPTIYARINEGSLQAFKVGKNTRITDESVKRYEDQNRYVPRS